MALMTKADLNDKKYKYTWTVSNGDNPHITGKPDSSRVSRTEGYEVLDFINAFAKKHNLVKKESGTKIEDMLHASKEVMRDKASAWILNNWKTWNAA